MVRSRADTEGKAERDAASERVMEVYDPRIDAIVESDNPALIARSLTFGNARQDDETERRVAEMADHCDEPVPLNQSPDRRD
jgi:hypothetical protein